MMFRNRKYYGFEFGEFTRRLRRYFEGNLNYKKIILILFVAAILFLYIGPYIFSWLFTSSGKLKGPTSRCLDDRLTPFYNKAAEFNALIQHIGQSGGNNQLSDDFDKLSRRFIPYVGNGYFGLEIARDAMFHVKYGRHLSQPIPYKPIVEFEFNDGSNMDVNGKQATVVDFINGIVHKFQCFGSDFFITNDFYAHRILPQVFIQEVRFTNTRNTLFNIDIRPANKDNTHTSSTKNIKLKHTTNKLMEFTVLSETIRMPKLDQKLSITIVSQRLPSKITLKKRGITKLDIIHVINYGMTSAGNQYKQKPDAIELAAVEIMTNILQQNQFDLAEHIESAIGDNAINKMQTFNVFRKQHIEVWNNLWDTGFHISTSLAENVINGDQINATIYAVLSHVRSYEFETNSSDQFKNDILKSLSYAEGCYDSYHTLQAGNLWKDMNNIEELNRLVQSWLLTLEKQGCHNLIKAGASGVLQAMVLSFGGFRFSNQHLEMNIHPKYLHRDYFFRRLNYGNMTHINVSISVTDENRAVMHVALDRSDGKYYACDAGCLDEPVALSQENKMFPVKLTEPLTAILYITLDKEHIEELRHAIHVKEVVDAPAHEHHVIALHKHGHQLGGLPTLFWVSIVALILVFHLFLCKLVIKEYCEPPEKLRYRYDKP